MCEPRAAKGWMPQVVADSGMEAPAVDERPALHTPPVACLYVCILCLQGKAGIDGEVKQSFILKADGD